MKNTIIKIIILLTTSIAALILISACRNAPRPPFLPPPEPLPPPDMRWDVQADFDILTPFVPQYSLHTRLREGALPELLPSNDYGLLLPYSSSIISENGRLHASKFGFVTIDGIVVTDLIYDSVQRAGALQHRQFTGFSDSHPAYMLYINIPRQDPSLAFRQSNVAVCALDGSWITPFDYIDAVFTNEAILLIRSYEEFDIDIMDYSGNRLYNTLELDWINDMRFDPQGYGGYDGSTSTTSFAYSVSHGYGIVYLINNTIAFIDILTGKAHYTEFNDAHPFIEGFAAVAIKTSPIGYTHSIDMLWGYVNTDLEVTITPRYTWAFTFSNGKAIIQLPNYTQQIVNTQGEVLFTVPEGYNADFSNGILYLYIRMYESYESAPGPIFLSDDFEVIPLSERLQSFHVTYLSYLGNGWFSTSFGESSVLLHKNEGPYFDEEHYFPGVVHISFTDGEFIICIKGHHIENDFFYSEIVKTIDGKEIIPPNPSLQITPVIQNDETVAFAANIGLFGFFPQPHFTPSKYTLYDTDGSIIIQDYGIIIYHESLELYSIQSANHFSWLDKNADLIIAIPLLSSTID